jgi:hypothetical protein
MAATQSSPGIVIQERDFTTVTNVSTPSVGVISGPFERGPINEVVTITSEKNLLATFGKPNDFNYGYWFTAAQFLNYGGTLKVIRTDNSAYKTAANYSNGSYISIPNYQYYETNVETATNNFNWAARSSGIWGNSIRVYMTDAGADQILTLSQPTGQGAVEWDFGVTPAGSLIGVGSGARGKVYNYSMILDLNAVTITGNFATGAATIGAVTVNVVAYDPINKTLEITRPAGSAISGVVTATGTITQSSITANYTAVTRKLKVVLNATSPAAFAPADTILDSASSVVTVTTADREYDYREIVPGIKWISLAARPGTSPYTAQKGGRNDEVHVVVMDGDGKITGTPNTLLEKWTFASKASDAKSTQGENNYYKDVVKNNSRYIYWGKHVNSGDIFDVDGGANGTWGQASAAVEFDLIRAAAAVQVEPQGASSPLMVESLRSSSLKYSLANGAEPNSQSAITNQNFSDAYNLVSDPEVWQIDYLLMGPSASDLPATLAKANILIDIVNSRKDCMAFISPFAGDILGKTDTEMITRDVVKFFDQLPSNSYVVFDTGYKYIYDKYNDTYRYIPCNADVAGLCVQTTELADAWFSPAGFQRGGLRNAIKMAYSPNKEQRDRLYSARINPIVSFPGQGIVLFGDKTALGYQSAFDRINVRRLFLILERTIGAAAKQQLFQQNDATTRSTFRNIVEPYLRDVQGRRGVYDYLVKCDDENNPPDAIDRGEFYAEIYVKPTRTINYITLTFIATRTGIAFEEVAS